MISDTYKIANQKQNASYVDNGEGLQELKREVGVSISLGQSIPALSSSIQSNSTDL